MCNEKTFTRLAEIDEGAETVEGKISAALLKKWLAVLLPGRVVWRGAVKKLIENGKKAGTRNKCFKWFQRRKNGEGREQRWLI